MNKKALAISIVIPVYNEQDHLADCLSAISSQTVAPAEVIVVNNNSTDSSIKIAKSYPFVRVINEKRQGIAWARSTGFNAAKADIIGRIDADTRLPADWVQRILEFYENPTNQGSATTGGCAFYNVRCPRVNQWLASQFVFRMNRLMMGHYILWGANMALPKKLWQEVQAELCQRNDIHEDLDVSIHLHRLGYKINYHATLIVGARMRRVFDGSAKLWPNLLMWPRTLRVHGIKDWPFSYLGAVFLFAMQPVPIAAELIARLFGRAPLN